MKKAKINVTNDLQNIDEKALQLGDGIDRISNLDSLQKELGNVFQILHDADMKPTSQTIEAVKRTRQIMQISLDSWKEVRKEIISLNMKLKKSEISEIELQTE
jgi:hypothetical protein